MRFVDTNVLLYAVSRDPSERPKREVAAELLAQLDLALSVQVLQEFYVQSTRATRADALTHSQAFALVESFARYPVQDNTMRLALNAMATRDRFGVSYWDAAVVEAARLLGCRELLSEDLADGQDYAGIVVRNPFR